MAGLVLHTIGTCPLRFLQASIKLYFYGKILHYSELKPVANTGSGKGGGALV